MAELDNRPQLPHIFPDDDEVTVTGEEHEFEQYETASGTEDKREYLLDKAPINRIESISGLDREGNTRTFSNGQDYELADKVDTRENTFEFQEDAYTYELVSEPDAGTITVTDENNVTYTEGTDYTLINTDGVATDTIQFDPDENTPSPTTEFTAEYNVTYPDSVVRWKQSANNLPQPDRQFFVTYTAPSIIKRYLDSSERKFDSVEDEIVNIIDNKFINSASGDSLDELGRLFGPLIGKRRDRTDTQYRIYLRSVVQSFISRGTVTGIKLAVSAGTGVDIADIDIIEDFTTTSYKVSVQPNTQITGSLLEEIAEIADPSGVEFGGTVIALAPEEMEADDSIDITEGQQLSDEAFADDSNQVNANLITASDASASDDSVALNTNLLTLTDSAFASDSVLVDDSVTTVTDDASADDSVAVIFQDNSDPENEWNNKDWNTLEWTENIEGNVESISIADTTTVTETSVAWESGNWESMHWAKSQN